MSGMRVRSEWHGNRIIARIPIVRRRALARAGHNWFARSQMLVPLREGHLQRTGKVTITSNNVTVAYSTRYGAIQHEHLGYRHAPGRQAKYITDAVRPNELRIALAEVIRDAFH